MLLLLTTTANSDETRSATFGPFQAIYNLGYPVVVLVCQMNVPQFEVFTTTDWVKEQPAVDLKPEVIPGMKSRTFSLFAPPKTIKLLVHIDSKLNGRYDRDYSMTLDLSKTMK